MFSDEERAAAAHHEAAHAIFLYETTEFDGISIYWNDIKQRWCGGLEWKHEPGAQFSTDIEKLRYRNQTALIRAKSAVAGMLAEAKLDAIRFDCSARFRIDEPLNSRFLAFLSDLDRSETRPGSFCLDFRLANNVNQTIPRPGISFSNSDCRVFWQNIKRSQKDAATTVLQTMESLDDPRNWDMVRSSASALIAKSKNCREHAATLTRNEFLAAIEFA